MKWTVENTSNIGRNVRVFDGDGVEYDKMIELDDETGKGRKFSEKDGEYVFSDDGRELKTEEVALKLPVRVVEKESNQ